MDGMGKTGMSDWPTVWLLFATHKRTAVCVQTIETLKEYLIYPRLHWHICDDGSEETDDGTSRRHLDVLLAAAPEGTTAHAMPTPPGQFNTGGNINRGIGLAQQRGSLIHILIFDDWQLTRPLDLRPMVDVLDNHPQVGFIRLSYRVPGMAGVCVRYDAPRLGNLPLMWLRLIRDWTLRNPWVTDSYMVSTQPYIAHLRFFQAYGFHPEHCPPGEAEIGLGRQYNESPLGENGPQILFPIGTCTVHAPWSHAAPRANDYAKI